MYRESARELLAFIDRSPSCYHVISNIKEILASDGYEELQEGRPWKLEAGRNYFVSRNGSSLIAFKLPTKEFSGYQIISSHSDSPTFKVKEHPEIVTENKYVKLNVEKYGGMICSPWFDRPLSVAGRIMVKEKEKICTRLVDIDRDLVMIPNLAVHMNREVNEGYKYNVQDDMLPVLGDETAKGSFLRMVAENAGVLKESVLSTDLFLYNRVKGSFWGANEEYISSGRLDDLQCAFASLQGFRKGNSTKSVAVYCVLDNEEVGSATKQGAASTFLGDTLRRINKGALRDEEAFLMALSSSFMISADNAHGVHPNYVKKSDPTNRPYLNEGIVIKYSANQKYTTDAVSAAVFKMICERAEVPYQTFVNRSDMMGGSTLGNISNTQVALNTVDVGLAQLAMHSPYESAGVKDTFYFQKAAEEFYSSWIDGTGDGEYLICRE